VEETGGDAKVFKNHHAALALLLADGATPSDCRKLTLPPEEVLDILETERGRERISNLLDKPIGEVRWDVHKAQLEALDRVGGDAVCLWDDAYPDHLHHIAQSPPIVYYKGTLDGVYRRGVAVVGTRKPTAPGAALARSLGRELADMGIAVVSGMARGIDSAAHRGSLDGGGGGIAVIGTSLDVPYPPENDELMLDLAAAGCVITEQPMGTTARPFVFPLRNRLISACSHAVVVVEAGGRSGALITAKWALEQGREVGAVPGFPGNFRSVGTNRLLKQGAFVVESAADVLAAVPRLTPAPDPDADPVETTETDGNGRRQRLQDDTGRLLAALGKTPTDPDALAGHSGLDAATVQRLLLHLEMSGRAERDALGRYTAL
jgi:DNA processing protein